MPSEPWPKLTLHSSAQTCHGSEMLHCLPARLGTALLGAWLPMAAPAVTAADAESLPAQAPFPGWKGHIVDARVEAVTRSLAVADVDGGRDQPVELGLSQVPKPADLWTPQRIADAMRALERLRDEGLITERQFQRKRAVLEERRAGRFKATALSQTDPAELNFIQNGGFEDINKNSAPNRSRWLWWGGWSWGGDYENFWETRKEYVRSGGYSAGVRCTGKAGRIGINTPKLPIVPGVKEYEFTVWAKGEGENELFLNFESGATGTLRKRVGREWEQVTLQGLAEPEARDFSFYIYVTGQGTVWLDDAKLTPLGVAQD